MPWLLGVAIFGAACAPSLPPFVSAETADVLARHEVAAGVAGGVATLTSDLRTVGLCCGGGEARVRVGLGHEQELDVEGAAVTSGDVWALSGRFAWKLALARWLAVSSGVGSMLHVYSGQKTAALGADLGATVSTPAEGRFRRAQLYTGARLGVMVPAASDAFGGAGLIMSVAVPMGVALHLPHEATIYFEGGALMTHTWYRAGDEIDSYPLFGGYGALAFAVKLR